MKKVFNKKNWKKIKGFLKKKEYKAGKQISSSTKIQLPWLKQTLQAWKSLLTTKEFHSFLWFEESLETIFKNGWITNKITYPAGSITFIILGITLVFQIFKRSQKPSTIIWLSILHCAIKQVWLCLFCVPEREIMWMKIGFYSKHINLCVKIQIVKWALLCCLKYKHYLPGRENIFLIRGGGETEAEMRQWQGLMCFFFNYSKRSECRRANVWGKAQI